MAVSNARSSRLHADSDAGARGWSASLGVLVALLVLIFITGGTSRYDTPHIMILRPVAILAAGFALLGFKVADWRAYRPIFLLLIATLLLVGLHLAPLPPGLWQSLPGRGVIVQIEDLVGVEGLWRPLSMFPEGTWNALFAMSVPVAVALLATQLDQKDQFRLLTVVVALCSASGLVGVLQAAGMDIRLYRIISETPGLFANRNHQAAMLATMFPMLAATALCAPRYTRNAGPLRVVVATGIVALVPIIIVTGSRMGIVVGALSFVCLVFMLFYRGRGEKGTSLHRTSLAVSGVFIAAGMVAGTIFLSRDVALGRISGGVEDELRLPVWQSIVEFAPQYLPWGTGVGSFVPIYQIHEPDSLLIPGYFNQAHNDWLDIVLTSGLPGIAVALVAVVMFAYAAIRAMSDGGVSGHLRRCGVIILLVLAFASLSDYPLRTPILSALLMIAAVWAWGPPSRDSDEKGQKAS